MTTAAIIVLFVLAIVSTVRNAVLTADVKELRDELEALGSDTGLR